MCSHPEDGNRSHSKFKPRRTLIMALEQIQRLLAKVFSKRSVKNLQVLSGGLINTNIRVEFEANYEPVVIRFYRNGAAVSAPGTDAGFWCVLHSHWQLLLLVRNLALARTVSLFRLPRGRWRKSVQRLPTRSQDRVDQTADGSAD